MNAYKQSFPIFVNYPELVYLDSASSAQKPQAVIDAEADFYSRHYANVHRGLYPLAEEATKMYEDSRAVVAEVFGAKDPNEVVFTRGATEGLNFLAEGLTRNLREQDVVLLTEMEHHANIVPWQQAAKRYGFKIRYIPVLPAGNLDLSHLDELLKGVKIVSFTQVSNVLGTVNGHDLIEPAKSAGALVIVDVAQSAGQLIWEVADLGVDFAVIAGHKLYGPTGIGALYGRHELLETLEPVETGGEMVKTVSLESSTWKEAPWKFEAGTPNIAGAIGLAAAIKWLKGAKHSNVEPAIVNGLRELGATVYGHDNIPAEPIVSFNLPGLHAHDIAALLAEKNIAIRAGHHCAMPLHQKLGIEASARVSWGLYNDETDIEKLLGALKEIRDRVR